MTTLVEYRPTEVDLAPEDVPLLADLVKASANSDEDARLLESFTPTRVPGRYVLRSGPFVGRLGLPSGAHLDFVSRFDFLDVFQLILLSMREPKRRDPRQTPVGPGVGVADLVADAFTREVEHIIGSGLAKGYVERYFEKPPYPGTLDISRHLARYGARPDRLVSRSRRMTNDIFINRALLAAVQILRQVPLASPDVARRLARTRPGFGGVSARSVKASEVANERLTKLTSRYRTALSLAELILRAQELLPAGATHQAMGIVFSMPKVWEDYVCLRIREETLDGDVEGGFAFHLSPGGLRAEADVVVRRNGEVVRLYDAKYKPIDKAPGRDDIYQMVTYCERLGLDEATLVHPGPPTHRSVTVGERRVHVRGLPGP